MNTGFPAQNAAIKSAVNSAFAETPIAKTPESEKVISVEIKEEVCLDGERYKIGATAKVSVKQYRALARYLLWLDGPSDHRPIAGHLLHPSAAAQVFEPRGEKK